MRHVTRPALGMVLALALGLPVLAVAAPDLTVGDAVGAPGATVNVPVTLVNGVSVVALQFDVEYDSASVTAGAATAGAGLVGTDHVVSSNVVEAGRVRVVVLSNTLALIPSGAIISLPFTIQQAASPGAKTLDLTGIELVLENADLIVPTSQDDGSVTVSGSCVLGDINPTGLGDTFFNLNDFVVGRRKLLGTVAAHPRDVTCGNVHPGGVTCDRAMGADNWCPNETGVPAFSLNDVVIMRRVLLGTLTFSCAGCAPQQAPGAAGFVPGDLAPLGALDGLVNVSDVVVALRLAVVLDQPTPGQSLRGDVAPATRVADRVLAQGNGRIDVADVVLLLRAAVGLDTLAWPTRTLVASVDSDTTGVAWMLSAGGWPEWATVQAPTTGACADGELATDVAPGVAGLSCVSDPATTTLSGEIVRFVYEGPRAVDPATLSLRIEAADADLSLLPVSARLTALP